ncbi:MAG: acid phosphatase, partial [Oxalobacteraceae bacterium]
MFWLPLLLATLPVEEPVRLNDVVMLGTHNSYKLAMLRKADPKSADTLDYAHRPLVEQLDAGARQLEIDIWYDPSGGLYA